MKANHIHYWFTFGATNYNRSKNEKINNVSNVAPEEWIIWILEIESDSWYRRYERVCKDKYKYEVLVNLFFPYLISKSRIIQGNAILY